MERLTEKHYKAGDGYYMKCSEGCHLFSCEECGRLGEEVDRLGQIEDILGDTYDLDRLRELVEADKAGRVLPKTSRVRKCPKCGKMNMYPRIDWKYFYCYSCETTFPAEEIIRSKAALAKEGDHPGVGLITREQVEKMRGEWKTGSDTLGALIYCSECGRGLYVADRRKYQRCIHQKFCELCGAPMTDKAVDILWKRLEAMQDEAETV